MTYTNQHNGEKDTGLICGNAQPIYVGDKFEVTEHQNECCNHLIKCEVKVNSECYSGYGLHDIKTGKLIANAGIATNRI